MKSIIAAIVVVAVFAGGIFAAVAALHSDTNDSSPPEVAYPLTPPPDESGDRLDSDSNESSPPEVAYPLTPPPDESGDLTVEQVEAFQGFPLYWVGEKFQGLELALIDRFVSPPGTLAPEDSVTFMYGTCTPSGGDGGCSVPLQIIVTPYCYVRPGKIADAAKQSGVMTLREGAQAQIISEGLRIWTGAVTLKIYGQTDDLENAASQALVSPNGLGPASADERLPAVDENCDAFEFTPYPLVPTHP